MRNRKIYWRRKGDGIIAEGKKNNKTIYLFQLPDIETVAKSSLFTQEKTQKIMEKISRLDFKIDKEKPSHQELRTTIIVRTPENDDKIKKEAKKE